MKARVLVLIPFLSLSGCDQVPYEIVSAGVQEKLKKENKKLHKENRKLLEENEELIRKIKNIQNDSDKIRDMISSES